MRPVLPSIIVFLLGIGQVFAQRDSLSTLTSRFSHYRDEHVRETIFMHTDVSLYMTGETMWFKIYCVDAFHRPMPLSRVAYVEILDKDNKAVIQTKVKMDEGMGNGSVYLPSALPSGNFLLRCYTQWMKNFGADAYYQQ